MYLSLIPNPTFGFSEFLDPKGESTNKRVKSDCCARTLFKYSDGILACIPEAKNVIVGRMNGLGFLDERVIVSFRIRELC